MDSFVGNWNEIELMLQIPDNFVCLCSILDDILHTLREIQGDCKDYHCNCCNFQSIHICDSRVDIQNRCLSIHTCCAVLGQLVLLLQL